MNKYPQTIWDSINSSYEFEELPHDDYTRKLIEKYINPVDGEKTAIEIGCYPGRYLAIFGKLGYTLYGIDLTPRTEETADHLQKMGYKVADIKRIDFFQFDKNQFYDLVSSFGFIEHFENYPDVIDGHCRLVKPGGYLVIGAPNFKYGIQFIFHSLFNSKSLKRHVLESMSPGLWKDILQNKGFKILWSGYCGGLRLWMDDDQTKTQRYFGLFFLRVLKIFKKTFFWVDFDKINNKYISCDFLVIAQRPHE
jgi:SAM-dependent methyltransferase